jgi:hypothetical protein
MCRKQTKTKVTKQNNDTHKNKQKTKQLFMYLPGDKHREFYFYLF